jgi:hypothetical protein
MGYFPPVTFSEIPARMLKLGVNRPWLCSACDYTPSTLASILAPKGTNKTDKALRRIWEALDREESRQAALASHPPFERQQLVLRPTDREYAAWCREAGGEPLQEWALAALNRAAARYLAGPVPLPAPEAEQQA